ARIEALIKYRREKVRQQKANVIRAWLTEEEMAKDKWAKIAGAVKYCTARGLVKCFGWKCKYTDQNKYLVEVEDRVDDETLESLRIIEECQAAAGELPDDFQGFSLVHGKSFDPEGDECGQQKEEGKIKLETFPEIVANQLPQRIKKYKD
ncbi:nipblb, partial [Symbiodinium necroappetens]